MQNRFVGDIGDFGKYGLLRGLAGEDLRLGVVWYLNLAEGPDDHGKLVHYLEDDKWGLRECAPELYCRLQDLVAAGDRNVWAVEQRGILPEGTRFCDCPLDLPLGRATGPTTPEERMALREAFRIVTPERIAEADLVFLDPDNGLAPESVEPHHRDAPKYVLPEEIKPHIRDGKSLVLYQHATRVPLTKLVSGLCRSLREAAGACRMWALPYHRQQVHGYFVLANPSHAGLLWQRTEGLLAGPWGEGGHFRLAYPRSSLSEGSR